MATTEAVLQTRSLEQLMEARERKLAMDEEDGDALLDELISALAEVRLLSDGNEELIREDEFSCRACDLIVHRSRLFDGELMICRDCAADPIRG